MTITELQTRLCGLGVSDVQLIGFVDHDEAPLHFRPMLQFVYFTCGTVVLEMESIRTTGMMQLALLDSIRFKLELEDGMAAAAMSLRELILADPEGSNALTTLHLWSPEDSPDGLRCSAARITLANGQRIFVDPSYHFGIRLGGAEQESIWKENWPGADKAPHHEIPLRAAR